MSEQRRVGPLIDELGVMIELCEQERITDVLILAKVTDLETGNVALTVAHNDLDWISQAGLHAAFRQVMDSPHLGGSDE